MKLTFCCLATLCIALPALADPAKPAPPKTTLDKLKLDSPKKDTSDDGVDDMLKNLDRSLTTDMQKYLDSLGASDQFEQLGPISEYAVTQTGLLLSMSGYQWGQSDDEKRVHDSYQALYRQYQESRAPSKDLPAATKRAIDVQNEIALTIVAQNERLMQQNNEMIGLLKQIAEKK